MSTKKTSNFKKSMLNKQASGLPFQPGGKPNTPKLPELSEIEAEIARRKAAAEAPAETPHEAIGKSLLSAQDEAARQELLSAKAEVPKTEHFGLLIADPGKIAPDPDAMAEMLAAKGLELPPAVARVGSPNLFQPTSQTTPATQPEPEGTESSELNEAGEALNETLDATGEFEAIAIDMTGIDEITLDPTNGYQYNPVDPPLAGKLLVINLLQMQMGIPGSVRMPRDVTKGGSSFTCRGHPDEGYVELIEELDAVKRIYIGEELGALERVWVAHRGAYENAKRNAQIYERRAHGALISVDAPNKTDSRAYHKAIYDKEIAGAKQQQSAAASAKKEMERLAIEIRALRAQVVYKQRSWRFPFDLEHCGMTIEFPQIVSAPTDSEDPSLFGPDPSLVGQTG